MKYIKSIILGGAVALGMTSCNDWLDVNVDPVNPTSDANTVENMLGWCQFYAADANIFAAMRCNQGCGDWANPSSRGTYGPYSYWSMSTDPVTTPYQWFFVGAGSNLGNGTMDPAYGGMYYKAMTQEAWHYAAAAKFLRAWGFMLMTDLYGEMPYHDALSSNALPVYDLGDEIYEGCLNEIDEAIELFGRTQDPSKPALSIGDSWNGGDTQKWIKACYLLKARWLNKLSKKGAGSASDLKWDADAILACLDKAMKSSNDDTVIPHNDLAAPTHDVLEWDEPVDYNGLFSVIGMNHSYFVSKMYVENLTNFGGYGVEDPRADHFIPWQMSKVSATTPDGLKWDGNWRRGVGVDGASDIQMNGGPVRSAWNAAEKRFYCNTTKEERKGDTIYVEQQTWSKGYDGKSSMLNFRSGIDRDGESAISGIFWSRPSSPTWVASYAEACFIKAEVLFKKGDKNGAYQAYKEGIKASIENVNNQLNKWINEDASNYNLYMDCPSFRPMEQAAIDNYLNNGIGTAGDITLGHIMTQKRIALGFSVEIWNDMRRYDYDPNIFFNFHAPYYWEHSATFQEKVTVAAKGPRRWSQCSHELNYNRTNLSAIGVQVPGSENYGGDPAVEWNNPSTTAGKAIWSVPVWWDSDQGRITKK